MGIQNSVNNLLGTAAVASAGIKHMKTESLRSQVSSLNAKEDALRSIENIEPKLQKANEDYNAAVELSDELEKNKSSMNDWAYDYSRKEADNLIQQYGKQKANFEQRIKAIQDKLEKVEKINDVSRKGWLSR